MNQDSGEKLRVYTTREIERITGAAVQPPSASDTYKSGWRRGFWLSLILPVLAPVVLYIGLYEWSGKDPERSELGKGVVRGGLIGGCVWTCISLAAGILFAVFR